MNRDFDKRRLAKGAFAGVAAAFLVVFSATSETLKRYDHRTNDADEGRYVVFLSLAESEGSAAGDAFALLGRGSYPDDFKVDLSFGLTLIEGTPTLGKTPKAHAVSVRNDDRTQTFVVQIDSAQYDEAWALFDAWGKKDSFLDPPDIEALNFCEILVKRLGMKKPFRPMLSRANPHVYFDDISKLNRNK